MIKLLFFVACLILICIFMFFNMKNLCTIWLFGKIFENIPVFMPIIIAFAVGVLIMVPFTLKFTNKKNKSNTQKTPKTVENITKAPLNAESNDNPKKSSIKLFSKKTAQENTVDTDSQNAK